MVKSTLHWSITYYVISIQFLFCYANSVVNQGEEKTTIFTKAIVRLGEYITHSYEQLHKVWFTFYGHKIGVQLDEKLHLVFSIIDSLSVGRISSEVLPSFFYD